MKHITCYACCNEMTPDQRLDADGLCPICGVEIELDDEIPSNLENPT